MVPSAESTKPIPFTSSLPSSFSSEKPSLICSKSLPQVPGATFLIFPPQPCGSSLFSGLPPLLRETFKDPPPPKIVALRMWECLSNMDEALGPTPTPQNPPPRPCPFSFLSSGRSNSCIVYLLCVCKILCLFHQFECQSQRTDTLFTAVELPEFWGQRCATIAQHCELFRCYSPEWLLSVVLGGTQKLLKGSCIRSSQGPQEHTQLS